MLSNDGDGMNWLECCLVLIVAAATTIATTPLAHHIACSFDAIDYPSSRRVNTHPIPRMGGIAMFLGMVASIVFILIGVHFWGFSNPFRNYLGYHINYPLLACGLVVMFGTGVVDDIRNLHPLTKFFWQIVAACLMAASGLLLTNIQNPFDAGGFINFGFFAYPITVFYLVAFANIINLIDGLDGLASGITAISTAAIFVFAVFASRFEAAMLAIILIGVCVGFLKSNFYPAKIFMGDSGSLLLGSSLGVISLFAVARSTLFISLLVPILAAGVPIIDTFATIVRRKRAHQSIGQADKGHLHHRLLRSGYSQRTTVLIMWAWTAVLSICAIILAESDGIMRLLAIIIAAVVTAFIVFHFHLLEPALRHHFNPREPKK